MIDVVLASSNSGQLLTRQNTLLGEFFSSLGLLDINSIKNTNYYVGISEVSFKELADKQLKGAEDGFEENNYYADFLGLNQTLSK